MTLEDLPAPCVPMSRERIAARRAALLEEIGRPGVRTAGRRLSTRLMLAPAVVALGLGAWLAGSWGSGAAPAYASWTPTAQRLDPRAVSGPAASCLARLSGMPRPPDTAAMRAVLAERRGVFTAVLIGGRKDVGVCLDGAADWMVGYTPSPGLSPDTRLSLAGNGGKTNAPDAARYVYGRVASSVTGAVVTTSDGRAVTATVSAGYYFAWWPSGADPRKITATDASGIRIGDLTPPAVPRP